jgi:thymidylate synthase
LDDETLGLTLFMRSNDAYGATYANQYAFTRLAQSVGAESGFTRVKMTLLSANMHIYEDSWKAVEKVINPEMPSARDRLGI